jgi:hypothetical protein
MLKGSILGEPLHTVLGVFKKDAEDVVWLDYKA